MPSAISPLPEKSQPPRPSIVLATPCYGGLVTQEYMFSVTKLLQQAADHGFDIKIALLGHDALITRARSILVANFLDTAAATHLLFVDSDISFEPEQVLRLLSFDKDFVAALYPLKTIDWERLPERAVRGEPLEAAGISYVGTFCDAPELKLEGDFGTARYAGGGFQLIKRRVFERLIAAHPELAFRNIHALPSEQPRSEHLYALFDCVIDPATGDYLSEDYAFCRRWRDLGGEIWLDRKSRLTHAGRQYFRGNAAQRYGASS